MATENYGYDPDEQKQDKYPDDYKGTSPIHKSPSDKPARNILVSKSGAYLSYEVLGSVSISLHIDDSTVETDEKLIELFEKIIRWLDTVEGDR